MELKIAALPNDLKNLACLGGELNLKAHYCSTFSQVHYKDINDKSKVYGQDWEPWDSKKRLSDAQKVSEKKITGQRWGRCRAY